MPENTRGLRLLMTADTLGGVWDYSLELARQLSRWGMEVTLATMGRHPSSAQRDAAAAIPNLVLEESSFRLEWMPETQEEELARAGQWLLQVERHRRPDLIHLNGYVHAALPWRAPCLVVAHSCVRSWWLAVKGENAPPSWDRYAERVRHGLSRADAVVVPTAALREVIHSLYGALPQSRTIWNGRDPGAYRVGEKGRFILTAGRLWDEAKNLQMLTSVAPDLSWPVIAAGDWRRPDGTGTPPSHVESLGVLSHADLGEWLSRAPIFVLPAKYEPFGLSILEAALAGCALVVGDIPTLRELWNGAALFVSPHDQHRLRTAVEALIRDERLRDAFGRAARERAVSYSAERMGAAYADLYLELLRRGAGRTAPRGERQPLAAKS